MSTRPTRKSLSRTTAQGTSQDGYENVASAWVGNSNFIGTTAGTVPNTANCGFVFDLGWDTDSQSVLIDPPVIDSMTVTVTQTGIAIGGPLLIGIAIVPEFAPADFSTSALPGGRGELFVGWGMATTFGAWTSTTPIGLLPLSTKVGDVINPNSSKTVPVVVSNLVAVLGQNRSWEENTAIIQQYTRDSRWSGKIALQFTVLGLGGAWQFGTAEQTIVTQPTMVVSYWPNWTGISGPGVRHDRSRIVRDHRFGMPIYADEIIEDDFRPGTWVRASDWDPDDDESLYRGNSEEGRTDDVPVE